MSFASLFQTPAAETAFNAYMLDMKNYSLCIVSQSDCIVLLGREGEAEPLPRALQPA